MGTASVYLRDVELSPGQRGDVTVRAGRIHAVLPSGASRSDLGRPAAAETIDGHGGVLLRGLHDHHIHLLSTAAALHSVNCDPTATPTAEAFRARLRSAAAQAGAGVWLRAVGYHERVAGPLDRYLLDTIVPDNPLRVQYRTGSLWCLNSHALRLVAPDGAYPASVELDAHGQPVGRIWRGDQWLGDRVPRTPVDLGPLGSLLANAGVTSLTDATVANGPAEIALLANAQRLGQLPQRIIAMTGAAEISPHPGLSDRLQLGPVKIVPDEWALPALDHFVAVIEAAHAQRRSVAVHVVTRTELVLTLAALAEAGAQPGDRLEHGGIIPPELIGEIARLGLTVVTQPNFVAERGDQYLLDVEPTDHDSLYRCASLLAAGIAVKGGTDAPFGRPDVWAAIKAATLRRCEGSGAVIGATEAVSVAQAVSLFAGADRPLRVGEPADLCLLRLARAAITTADLSHDLVAATMIDGVVRRQAL